MNFFKYLGRREYGKHDDPNVSRFVNEIDNRIGPRTAYRRARYVNKLEGRGCLLWLVPVIYFLAKVAF